MRRNRTKKWNRQKNSFESSRGFASSNLSPGDLSPSDLSSSSSLDRLQEEVRLALTELPFPAYLAVVRRVLVQGGYASVRTLGKGVRRQSLSIGGFDLLGFCHTDMATGLTAIQIKQAGTLVTRRFVDELRGAMLRLGAESGLLVAAGPISPAAREAAAIPAAFPVRLVDGWELASRLVERGEGVCVTRLPRRPGQAVEWGVDRDYFSRLAERAAKAGFTKGNP